MLPDWLKGLFAEKLFCPSEQPKHIRSPCSEKMRQQSVKRIPRSCLISPLWHLSNFMVCSQNIKYVRKMLIQTQGLVRVLWRKQKHPVYSSLKPEKWDTIHSEVYTIDSTDQLKTAIDASNLVDWHHEYCSIYSLFWNEWSIRIACICIFFLVKSWNQWDTADSWRWRWQSRTLTL